MKYLVALLILLPFSAFADHDFLNIGYTPMMFSKEKNLDGTKKIDGKSGFYLGTETQYSSFKYLNFSSEYLIMHQKMHTQTEKGHLTNLGFSGKVILFWDYIIGGFLALAGGFGAGHMMDSYVKATDTILAIGPVVGVTHMNTPSLSSHYGVHWGVNIDVGIHLLSSTVIKKIGAKLLVTRIPSTKTFDDDITTISLTGAISL